jgi:predicted DNA-binding protein (UPF0251 family)
MAGHAFKYQPIQKARIMIESAIKEVEKDNERLRRENAALRKEISNAYLTRAQACDRLQISSSTLWRVEKDTALEFVGGRAKIIDIDRAWEAYHKS